MAGEMIAQRNIVHAVRKEAVFSRIVRRQENQTDAEFRRALRSFGGPLLETLGLMHEATQGGVSQQKAAGIYGKIARRTEKKASGVSPWKVDRAALVMSLSNGGASQGEILHALNSVAAGSAKVVVGKNVMGDSDTVPFAKLPEFAWIEVNVGGVPVAIVQGANSLSRNNFPTEFLLAENIGSLGLARLN